MGFDANSHRSPIAMQTMFGRQRTVALLGAFLCVTACVYWVGDETGGRDGMMLEQRMGSYDSSSKSDELSIIQRALRDEERGTTPPRVLTEEREEVEQQKLDEKINRVHTHILPQVKAEAAVKAVLAGDFKLVAHAASTTDATANAVPVEARKREDEVAKLKAQLAAAEASEPAAIKEASPAAVAKVAPVESTKATAATIHLLKAIKSAAQSRTQTAVKPAMQPVKQFETARDTALAQPADKWTLKEEQIKSAYGKEISRAQTSTMKKVRHLQNKVMKEVSKTLQRGQDKVTSLKNKEKAAETVVEYDKKQADLEHQLAEVQARAAARAQALERKLAAVDTIEKKFASNPNKPLLARRAARTPAVATLLAATSNGGSPEEDEVSKLKAELAAAEASSEKPQLEEKEDYDAEDATKQKIMRDKVKAEAAVESNLDEKKLAESLEEKLEKEVLNMDIHPPAQPQGTQFTCVTGTKAQILT